MVDEPGGGSGGSTGAGIGGGRGGANAGIAAAIRTRLFTTINATHQLELPESWARRREARRKVPEVVEAAAAAAAVVVVVAVAEEAAAPRVRRLAVEVEARLEAPLRSICRHTEACAKCSELVARLQLQLAVENAICAWHVRKINVRLKTWRHHLAAARRQTQTHHAAVRMMAIGDGGGGGGDNWRVAIVERECRRKLARSTSSSC